MKKIGIIVAMNRESGISQLFTDLHKETVCGIPFYTFNAKDNLVTLTTSGIGEISSAMAVSILISRYGVDEIINYGYVGALKKDLPLNVIVGVNSIVHTDMDLTAFGNALGQYDERNEVCFIPSERLTRDILGKEIYLGKLASSDKFISDGNVKTTIATKFEADICDMEGAGIAVCCTRADVPFALIKVVADGVEDDCTNTFFANSNFGVDRAIELIAEYICK